MVGGCRQNVVLQRTLSLTVAILTPARVFHVDLLNHIATALLQQCTVNFHVSRLLENLHF